MGRKRAQRRKEKPKIPPAAATRPSPTSKPGASRRGTWLALGAATLAIAGAIAWFGLAERKAPPHAAPIAAAPAVAPLPPPAPALPPATFVGGQACASCHTKEFAAWRGSHHDLAMQAAGARSVLGDFADARFTHAGVTSTFFTRDGRFYVNTDGPDGKLADFEIKHAFGVDPLQQYLIEFPGGRLQALGIAWDTRPKTEGGQRWFHLYPDQTPAAGSLLHWTGRDQTWNYQCADCHSTELRKNFDLAANAYSTARAEENVGCEACHGPGSRHVAWAAASTAATERKGLVASPRATDGGRWEMNADTGIAKRSAPLVSTELDTCAPCHSRRKVIARNAPIGSPFLDSNAPALLAPGYYHADGQIDGEVFEYGSFVQSRMHRAGVVCTDCHDAHSLKLRAEGNGLCAQCHLPAKFDVAEHHRHRPGEPGAQCVACHMPRKTYMIVDERRDHSFRVPRPDLSVAIGTPDACTQCHADKSADWAATTVASWHPNGRQTRPHFGTALHAGRTGAVDAERLLDRLILDLGQPAIARASALALLQGRASRASEPAITAAIRDPDPLVRAEAMRTISPQMPRPLLETAMALLSDPVRSVRIAAARAFADADPQTMTPDRRIALSIALRELVAAEMTDADRPETHLNLGLLNARRQQTAEAEAAYRTALRLDPRFVPALVNLADLERQRGRENAGAALLRQAMALEPGNGDVRHSLGLSLVRQQNYAEALPLLREATELAPGNPRYAYVYAVALNSSGAPAEAIAALERAHAAFPADRDVLQALALFERDRGEIKRALAHAQALAALDPLDPQIRALVEDHPSPRDALTSRRRL